MALHPSIFEYHKPSDEQLRAMGKNRAAASVYLSVLEEFVPDGPDKTYVMRKLREVAMWANVAITRHPDGAPR